MPADKFLVTYQAPNGTVYNISNGVKLSEEEGIKTTADTFSVQVKSPIRGIDSSGNELTIIPNDGDNIKIYFWKDGSTPTLVMDGFLKVFSLNFTVDRQTWTLQGQNRLEVVLNAPVPASYSSTGSFTNSAAMIKNLIGLANPKWLPARYGPTITAELKSLGGNIDDTTNTLDTISYYRTDTPVFVMIDELSNKKFTGAPVENYIFYLDSNNKFFWEPPSTTPSATNIEVGDFIEAKIEKSLYDVINYAIIDCGVDFNGKPIKTYAYNSTGATRGFRGKYFAKPELAKNLKSGIASATPFGTSDRETGSTNNQTFRNKIRDIGKAVGNSIVATLGQPKYKATITFKGTTSFSKGALHKIRISNTFKDGSDANVNELQLRIRSIEHTFTSRGWVTALTLEQDETTIEV